MSSVKVYIHFTPNTNSLGMLGMEPKTYYGDWSEEGFAFVQSLLDTNDPMQVVKFPASETPGGEVVEMGFGVDLIRVVRTGHDGW